MAKQPIMFSIADLAYDARQNRLRISILNHTDFKYQIAPTLMQVGVPLAQGKVFEVNSRKTQDVEFALPPEFDYSQEVMVKLACQEMTPHGLKPPTLIMLHSPVTTPFTPSMQALQSKEMMQQYEDNMPDFDKVDSVFKAVKKMEKKSQSPPTPGAGVAGDGSAVSTLNSAPAPQIPTEPVGRSFEPEPSKVPESLETAPNEPEPVMTIEHKLGITKPEVVNEVIHKEWDNKHDDIWNKESPKNEVKAEKPKAPHWENAQTEKPKLIPTPRTDYLLLGVKINAMLPRLTYSDYLDDPLVETIKTFKGLTLVEDDSGETFYVGRVLTKKHGGFLTPVECSIGTELERELITQLAAEKFKTNSTVGLWIITVEHKPK